MHKRKVIIHYHLYKNAGSSIDNILLNSFGDRWENYDPHPSEKLMPADIEKFIDNNPKLLAISSHQVIPPLPSRFLEIHQIVFLRHPIERIMSCYLFECKTVPKLAEPKITLRDFIIDKLGHRRKSVIEEFHTMIMANCEYDGKWDVWAKSDEELLTNAKNFINSLNCFGIVDRFDDSLLCYSSVLSEFFPEFKSTQVHINRSQNTGMNLDGKLKYLANEVGDELYQELLSRNRMDLALYEHALDRFELQLSVIAGAGVVQ